MAQVVASAEPLLSVKEVAQHLGMTEGYARMQARSGSLPGIKLGVNTWRFHPAVLRAWLAEDREP